MVNQPWLDDVRRRLEKQFLPPSYIQRFVSELTDHFHDLTEENMEADAVSRLGEPQQVAEAAVTAYRRRSFLGRHPTAALLVFGLSPIVSFITIGLVFAVVYNLPLLVCLNGVDLGPVGTAVLFHSEELVGLILPLVLLSIFYCRLARRLGMGKQWIFMACVVLAVIGWGPGVFEVPEQEVYNLSLSLFAFPPNAMQVVQLLIPLAICWWFMRRNGVQGQLQLAT